ncbi:transposase [Bradyrhizobium sp. JR3.5]
MTATTRSRDGEGTRGTLRARAVALVEDGESRREAARALGLGASTAIRWIERWATTGSVAALPGTVHSRSPLEAHRQWLLDLVAAEPDLTLEEIRARLKSEKRLKIGANLDLALLRTPRYHVQKKLCTPPNRIVLMSLQRVPS